MENLFTLKNLSLTFAVLAGLTQSVKPIAITRIVARDLQQRRELRMQNKQTADITPQEAASICNSYHIIGDLLVTSFVGLCGLSKYFNRNCNRRITQLGEQGTGTGTGNSENSPTSTQPAGAIIGAGVNDSSLEEGSETIWI